MPTRPALLDVAIFVLAAGLVSVGCGSSGANGSGTGGSSAGGTGGSMTAGTSGAGTAGTSGAGTAGTSGAGTAGTSGAGTAGTSGAGTAGAAGTGTAGAAGTGTAGTSGTGTAGTLGAAGRGGTTGTGGTAGGAAGGRGGSGVAGRGGAGGGAAGSSGGGGSGGATTACLTFGTPTQVGTIAGATVSMGPSGMVASRAHPGVLYAEMDGNTTGTTGPAIVYAMTLAGAALGEYTLTGVTQVDWEDLEMGAGPVAGTSYIYVADIGDNNANRTEIQIYRVAEPNVSTTQAPVQQSLTPEVLRFTYPDQAHNAETLIIDPVSGDILIVTKEASGTAALFRAPGNTPVNTPTVLTKLTTVAVTNATAGDASPNGDRFIVRTNGSYYLWARAATLTATFMAAPRATTFAEGQSEGITFSADGKSWLSTAEMSSAIFQANATCP